MQARVPLIKTVGHLSGAPARHGPADPGAPGTVGMAPRRVRTLLRGRCARAHRSAFTLLEILLVVGLLVALTIMAWPALSNRITAAELPESATKLQSLLFLARSQAIMDHKRFRVRFDQGLEQPLVEVEPDPINAANEWVETTEPWAADYILLGDVRVHAVKLGRPVYLTAQITRDDAEAESEEGLSGVLTRAQEEVATLVQGRKGLGEGEDWPAIIFDVDGRTDWATVIIAKLDPDEELEPEDEQRWVVLDGRTGLAQITEQVTEVELADAGFYINRDKLGMPETGQDGEIIFTTPGQQVSPGGSTTVMGPDEAGAAGGSTALGGGDLSGAIGAATSALGGAGAGAGIGAGGGPGAASPGGLSDEGGRPRGGGRRNPGGPPNGGGPTKVDQDGGNVDEGRKEDEGQPPLADEDDQQRRPGGNRRPGGRDTPRGGSKG